MDAYRDRRRNGWRWVAGVGVTLALASCMVASEGAPSKTGAPTRGTLVIHGTGDVSLDPLQIRAFGTRGYDWAWGGLGGLFLRDDLTVVNLECPATDMEDPAPKAFPLRCDPEALPAAHRAGVDVVSQANNHAYDDGAAGLLDSLAAIRAAGMVPVGAGDDQSAALRAADLKVDGWTVAVLGIDEVLDPVDEVAGPDKPGTAAGHDFALTLRAVRKAAEASDLVVVMIHWGVELEARPRLYQVKQAHRMIDAGADVIFGSHAHRLQPMETYRGRPIFYSLGNLVWPRITPITSATAVAEVVVSPDGEIRARLLPVEIVSDGHPVLRREIRAARTHPDGLAPIPGSPPGVALCEAISCPGRYQLAGIRYWRDLGGPMTWGSGISTAPTWPGPAENLAEIATEVITGALK